jgi:hypothetical protein
VTLHIVKLCVGCDSIEDLAAWQKQRLARLRRRNPKARLRHVTRNTPRRGDEVLDGGSLYWVIKGLAQVRQRIIGLKPALDEEGQPACAIELGVKLVRTEFVPWRPFQGWRYLEAADAPPDRTASRGHNDALPPKLAAELRALGLL